MDSGEIKAIDPNSFLPSFNTLLVDWICGKVSPTATTSAETSRKVVEGSRKGKVKANKILKIVQKPHERKNGRQDALHSRLEFEFNSTPANCPPEIERGANKFKEDLENSKGFLQVDSESRSFDVAGFYRVYPYYDWDPDPKQIKDQKAILNHCCDVAVRRHNQRTHQGDHLIFDKLVSANMLRDGFPIYFIILNAYHQKNKDLTREYKTKVQYIRYHGVTEVAEAIINIHLFQAI